MKGYDTEIETNRAKQIFLLAYRCDRGHGTGEYGLFLATDGREKAESGRLDCIEGEVV